MNKLLQRVAFGVAFVGINFSTATAEEWRFNNFLQKPGPESAQLEQFVTEVK